MSLEQQILADAQAWAKHAELRAWADKYYPDYGTIEEAILMCMLHLWVLENLDEMDLDN